MVEPMMGVGDGKVPGSLLEVVQKLVVDILVEGGFDQSLSVILVESKVDEKFSIVLDTVDFCCSVVTVVDEGHGSSIGFLNGGWHHHSCPVPEDCLAIQNLWQLLPNPIQEH